MANSAVVGTRQTDAGRNGCMTKSEGHGGAKTAGRKVAGIDMHGSGRSTSADALPIQPLLLSAIYNIGGGLPVAAPGNALPRLGIGDRGSKTDQTRTPLPAGPQQTAMCSAHQVPPAIVSTTSWPHPHRHQEPAAHCRNPKRHAGHAGRQRKKPTSVHGIEFRVSGTTLLRTDELMG